MWLIAHAIPGSEAGETEGWVDPGLTVADADALGQQVSVSTGVLWSVSSRLFYWVLTDVARHTSDAELAGHLNEIDRENLGWFGLDAIAPGQRHEVRRIITEHLVDDAQREFPTDMPGRPSALALLKDLAAMVTDGAS